MASRKQRRRRAKERRHEYEYVYVDDTGQEIEPPPEDKPERDRSRSRANANGVKATKGKAARPLRQAKPPSWNRSIRRALLFLPLDRKSTRLNSSHVELSYAVFCLKKK